MQKKSFGFFSHSHSPIHRYIFIVGHSSTFFLVVFAVVLVVFVARVEWNSINIRPLTCILQAKSLPQSFISSCCFKYDNIIISSFVSVCTDVYLISDCEWSSKKDELANTEYLMLLNITKWNAMRCDTMRWDAVYDFLLSRLPCNYRATVLFDFTLLAEKFNRNEKAHNKQTVLPSKSNVSWNEPFDCWRIWHKT